MPRYEKELLTSAAHTTDVSDIVFVWYSLNIPDLAVWWLSGLHYLQTDRKEVNEQNIVPNVTVQAL